MIFETMKIMPTCCVSDELFADFLIDIYQMDGYAEYVVGSIASDSEVCEKDVLNAKKFDDLLIQHGAVIGEKIIIKHGGFERD